MANWHVGLTCELAARTQANKVPMTRERKVNAGSPSSRRSTRKCETSLPVLITGSPLMRTTSASPFRHSSSTTSGSWEQRSDDISRRGVSISMVQRCAGRRSTIYTGFDTESKRSVKSAQFVGRQQTSPYGEWERGKS